MTWQPKSSLTVETSHWTSSNMDSVPLHSSSRLWDLDFQMKCKIYFHLKRGLWTTGATVQVVISTAQVKKCCFWRCLLFRIGLVALSLKRLSVVTLDALIQLAVHPCEALSVFWISFARQYSSKLRSSLLLCALFLPTQILLPVNFAFKYALIQHLCKQPTPFSNTLCDLPFLWRAQCSFESVPSRSLPHYCGFKNKRYPILDCRDVINWNSNVNIS